MALPHGCTAGAATRMMRGNGLAGASALAACALAACAGTDVEGGRVSVRDSAGIRIVESHAPRWNAGDEWRVDPVPLVSIGSALEGEPATQFTNVAGAVRLSDGRIAIADGRTAELRFFHADGRHIRTVGRQGSGPGEFNSIMSLIRLSDDSLLVSGFPPRHALYDSSGELARMVDPPRVGPGGRPVAPVHRFPDGSVLARAGVLLAVEDRAGSWTESTTVYRARPGMDSADVWGRIPLFALSSSGRRSAAVGYSPTGIIAAHGDRVYFGYPQSYDIEVRGPDGSLQRLLRRVWTPVAVDQGARDAYTSRTYGPDPTPVQREMIASLTFAGSHPAYATILPDREGNLWVQATRTTELELRDDAATAPRSWSVFDHDGVWLGDVEMPGGLTVREIGADYVLGVVQDADQVPHIRLHRLRKGR